MATDQTTDSVRAQLLHALDHAYVTGVLGYGTPEALLAAYDVRRTAPVPSPPPGRPAITVEGLVAHGEPIDIGWIGHSLDARLRLSVRPGMDPAEREQLLATVRDALAPVVPIRRTGREASS
ncbi:hypothetical protein ACF1G4_03390 [Streptomyces caelestis]